MKNEHLKKIRKVLLFIISLLFYPICFLIGFSMYVWTDMSWKYSYMLFNIPMHVLDEDWDYKLDEQERMDDERG